MTAVKLSKADTAEVVRLVRRGVEIQVEQWRIASRIEEIIGRGIDNSSLFDELAVSCDEPKHAQEILPDIIMAQLADTEGEEE